MFVKPPVYITATCPAQTSQVKKMYTTGSFPITENTIQTDTGRGQCRSSEWITSALTFTVKIQRLFTSTSKYSKVETVSVAAVQTQYKEWVKVRENSITAVKTFSSEDVWEYYVDSVCLELITVSCLVFVFLQCCKWIKRRAGTVSHLSIRVCTSHFLSKYTFKCISRSQLISLYQHEYHIYLPYFHLRAWIEPENTHCLCWSDLMRLWLLLIAVGTYFR